tara:strand:- start:10 stop:1059 length:1050 start_codon:yes stop_codon:yes gene_type:complete
MAKINKPTPNDNIPVTESKNKGIPVTDVRSAQEALMAQLQSPATEQAEEQEMQPETEDLVSEEAMEVAESVEEATDNPDGLTVDDLVEDTLQEEEDQPKLYTVKIDGKDTQVTEDELLAGYSRQADYTRKSQVLAEQRKKADDELATTQQERQRYISQLEQFGNQSKSKLDAFKSIDWEKLKAEDPMEYMSKRDAYRDLQENIRASQEEQQRETLKFQQEQLKKFEEVKKVNYDDLIVRVPQWADPEKGAEVKQNVKNYAQERGFTQQELDGLIDARSIEMLYKAMLYDKLVSQKIQTKKQKTVPKVTKPGAGTSKTEVASEKVKQQRQRLKRTGHVNDASKLIESLLS